MALVKQTDSEDLVIKPEAVTPAVKTNDWPLLLKNWDQCASLLQTEIYTSRLTSNSSTRPHRPLHSHPRRLHPSSPRA